MVPKSWLLALSGVMWCGVGLLLMRLVWIWSVAAGWKAIRPFLAAGLVLSLGTRYFFGKMASRDRVRIRNLPDKPCIFAFQSWWSYPLVVFMMGLGLALKSSALPRIWLAGMYLAIGVGLFVAGLNYFSWLWGGAQNHFQQ